MYEQTVSNYSNKEGFVDRRLGKRWTYKEWDVEVNKLAHAFQMADVKKGDRVSTILFNTAEFALTLFACMKIGAIFNPINFRLTEKEIDFILKDASPKIVIVENLTIPQVEKVRNHLEDTEFWSIDANLSYPSFYEKMKTASSDQPFCDVTEDDYYAVMYTSGTTGLPKGVLHTHRNMVDQCLAIVASIGISEKDRGLTFAPMFHCAELHCALLPRIMMGATNVILHHFDSKEFLTTVKEERITTFFAAPTMLNMVLQEDLTHADFSTLRSGLYGGAAMAPALVKRVSEAFKIDLYQAYGMTEMGPAITCLMEDDQLKKAGSAGRPLLLQEVRVVRTREDGPSEPDDQCEPGELGEIIVRGPSMMVGYFNRPEATEEALYKGWYHSGDIGSFDTDGFLWVSDRLKDMIVSGGENIYSREVEDVLFEHPGVLDVAVVGMPDEMWGEKVVAFIVKKESDLTAEQLDEHCISTNHLARYKRPRKYEFVETLPRNASGKLQKFHLRNQIKMNH